MNTRIAEVAATSITDGHVSRALAAWDRAALENPEDRMRAALEAAALAPQTLLQDVYDAGIYDGATERPKRFERLTAGTVQLVADRDRLEVALSSVVKALKPFLQEAELTTGPGPLTPTNPAITARRRLLAELHSALDVPARAASQLLNFVR